MTAPQYPAGYAPAPQFPPVAVPQQPAWPPQQPMAPQAPQQPGFPPPGPQGYPVQQPPAQPLVQASLDDYFTQPATGFGPAWSWLNMPLGTVFAGIVARAITSGDVEQQTQPNSNQPMTYRDGRPVLVMKVPMFVQPDQKFPEGKAQWYVQGQSRDELMRAMTEAGAPEGPPEAGAVIAVTLVGERRNKFNTMSKQYAVQYQRPTGAAPVAAPQAPVAAPQAPVAPPAEPEVQSAAIAASLMQRQPAAAAPVAPPAAPAAPPVATEPLAELDPERAALLAKLTGQAPAAPAAAG